jgi:ribosomal protein S18 acetylase RimI-like enzyme
MQGSYNSMYLAPPMTDITVRRISAEQTHPLRRAVLRPYQSPDQLVYPGDDAPDTLHLGAYLDSEIVGVVSVYREPPPGEADEGAWRLRGMAIIPKLQGQGYGRALLKDCLAHIVAQGGREVWCNARTAAAKFYRALGFEVVGEEYEMEGTGPHYTMRRAVGERAT